jgi:hypothetical protein
MQVEFDIKSFINNLSEDLVRVFSRSSKQGTHPDEIGRTKEIQLTKQLEALLPNGVGVGRGKVIDCFGKTSKQCDIILYEKNIIPTLVSDGNTDFTYYPCEGVIAVGEIKSTLNIEELKTSLKKLSIIKELNRKISDDMNWRKCLNSFIMTGYIGPVKTITDEVFDPINKPFDSIFTFIFANSNLIADETIMHTLIDEFVGKIEYCPNAIYSVNKPIFYKALQMQIWGEKPNAIVSVSTESPFGALIQDLMNYIDKARTQAFKLSNYYKNRLGNVERIVLFNKTNETN